MVRRSTTLMLAITSVSLLGTFPVWSAEPGKTDKKIEQAIAAYGKAVDSAEQKGCNTALGKPLGALSRSCESDVKALDTQYSKYSADVQAVTEIQALHARHLKLIDASKEFTRLASLEELAKPYRRAVEAMEKTSCVLTEVWRHAECGDALSNADETWSGIPKPSQTEPPLAELHARHVKLKAIQAQMAKSFEANREAEIAKNVLESEFTKATENLPWNHLMSGKAGQGGQYSDINTLSDDSMLRFKQLAIDCDGKFAVIINNNTDRQAYCELSQNAVKYKNVFTALCYQSYLNAEISHNTEILAKFKQQKVVEGADLDLFTKEFKTYSQAIIRNLNKRFQLAAMTPPSTEGLLSLEVQFKPLLTTAIASNKWTDHEYTAPSTPINTLARSAAQKQGLALLKIGVVDKTWTIDKNDYGVPLRKYQGGYLLLKRSGEEFCRKQYATFVRVYQGKDYAPASAVNVFSTVVPVPCK
jgi:hypothetical protein